jgi:peptidoglycan/LPS O-acetylase OafA/YrhL
VKRADPRFDAVDTLRALAALAVFGFHLALQPGLAPPRWLIPYAANLNVGVSIFFVISGFVIYRPFARARLDGEPLPPLGPYLARRAARIVPAYWVALALITLWLGLPGVFTWTGIPTYFGFLQVYREGTTVGGIGQAWSLCVEIAFYVGVALVAAAAARRPARSAAAFLRSELALVGGIVAVSVLWKLAPWYALQRFGSNPDPATMTLPAYADQLALGMAAAVVSVWAAREGSGRLPRVPAWGGIVLAVAAFVCAGLLTDAGTTLTRGGHLLHHVLFGLVGLGLLASAVLPDRGPLRRVLTHPVLRWGGFVSYGFYLWHLAVLRQLTEWGWVGRAGRVGYVVAALAGATVLAAASWYLVERPALRWTRPRAARLGDVPLAAFGAVGVLALPTVLAFASGGYFDVPRLWAAVGVWLALLAVLVVAPHRLSASRPALLAYAGLGLMAALAVASAWWAPRRGPAFDDAGRDLLYLGALAVGAAVLRGREARAAEPALAAGAVLVIVYGLSERLLPGVIDLAASRTALGRLEQPLTYWNATGALAALGLVLAFRIAGDATRGGWLRVAAGAATVPLGAGLALSYSRGALLAAAAGMLVLAVLQPSRTALRAIAVGALAAFAAGVAVSLAPGVRTLSGGLGRRELEGAVVLVALLALAAAAAWATRRVADPAVEPQRGDARGAWRPRSRPWAVAAGVVAVFVGLVLAGAALDGGPHGDPPDGATAQRLASIESNRYAYWRVALRGAADHPLRGVGGGGFSDLWLHERTIADPAGDAHSLYLETAVEYGLLGLLALALLLAGLALGARRAWHAEPVLAAGPIAGLAAWAVHAGVDWDWEMPALTLVAVLLAAVLLGAAGRGLSRGKARLALVPAIAVAALLVVALRAATLTEEGRRLLPAGPDRIADAQFEQARAALQRARAYTLDPEPEQLEAVLLVNHGRLEESIRLLRDVVAQEPRNASAWTLLAGALERTGAPDAAEARRRAQELAPPPVGNGS